MSLSTIARTDHVVLTRFNVPTPGVESLIRAKEGWLRRRVELFETYTVPSMKNQRVPFTWLVYVDPASPIWFKKWLEPFADCGLFVPIFREVVTRDDLASDLREHVDRRADILVTTNLDNDDGLAEDFLSQIQGAVVSQLPSAVYLAHGLILSSRGLYLREDRENAFCSVFESWNEPMTCWADWHNRLGRHMPVVVVQGQEAWLQIVHDVNVSNRVNGVLASPDQFRPRFQPMLNDVRRPSRRVLALDRTIARPARFVRESYRAALKRVVIFCVGTRGLDHLKEVVRRGSFRSPKDASGGLVDAESSAFR